MQHPSLTLLVEKKLSQPFFYGQLVIRPDYRGTFADYTGIYVHSKSTVIGLAAFP